MQQKGKKKRRNEEEKRALDEDRLAGRVSVCVCVVVVVSVLGLCLVFAFAFAALLACLVSCIFLSSVGVRRCVGERGELAVPRRLGLKAFHPHPLLSSFTSSGVDVVWLVGLLL